MFNSWFSAKTSIKSYLYMYNGSSQSLSKLMASQGIFVGSIPMVATTSLNVATRSSRDSILLLFACKFVSYCYTQEEYDIS